MKLGGPPQTPGGFAATKTPAGVPRQTPFTRRSGAEPPARFGAEPTGVLWAEPPAEFGAEPQRGSPSSILAAKLSESSILAAKLSPILCTYIYILIPTGSKDPADWAYYENYPSSGTRVAGYEKFTGMKDLDYALTSPESNCATYVDGYKSLLDKPCTRMDSYSLHGRLCEFVFSE